MVRNFAAAPKYFATMLKNRTASLLIRLLASALLGLCFSTLRLLQLFPCFTWIIVKLMNAIATVKLPTEDYWSSLFTRPMFESMVSSVLLEFQKSAVVGRSAPNPHLVCLDRGRTRCRLMDFAKGSRPLVVAFCSWTCPVFRARVGEFLSLVQDFGDVADFVNIYIEEAHPNDGWSFKNNISIPRHQSLEQRCQAAQIMLRSVEFCCPVVVDTMDDGANRAYAGFPIRLYIIKEGSISYAGGVGPTFYNPMDVRQWLQDARTAGNKRHRG